MVKLKILYVANVFRASKGDRGDAGLPGEKGLPGIGFNITGPPGYDIEIFAKVLNNIYAQKN